MWKQNKVLESKPAIAWSQYNLVIFLSGRVIQWIENRASLKPKNYSSQDCQNKAHREYRSTTVYRMSQVPSIPRRRLLSWQQRDAGDSYKQDIGITPPPVNCPSNRRSYGETEVDEQILVRASYATCCKSNSRKRSNYFLKLFLSSCKHNWMGHLVSLE